MEEIWKTYKIRNKLFEVSNLGNVKGETNIYYGRKYLGDKHSRVSLLYRVVDFLFRGPLPEGYVVHHIDGKKNNDSLDNLQRMTKSEHIKHHHTNKKWNIFTCEKQRAVQTGQKRSNKTKRKMSKSREGRHWFTNGINNKFCYNCPEGYVEGRIILKIKKQ